MDVVNPVPDSELEPWVRALASTLLGDPYAPEFAGWVARWQARWHAERTWGVRSRGRWVGTLATEPRVLTVPGTGASTVDGAVDALTGVSVAATHRRRGLLTEMITRSLRAAKERGDALGALIAAEWPIYGRFGYGPAVRGADYVYRPRARGAAIASDAAGTVREVEPEELLAVAPAVFDRARRLRAGQIDRSSGWWARELGVGFDAIGPQRHWMLHEGPDGPDGLLAWRVTRDFDLDGSYGAVRADLVTAGDLAERNLWAYLSGFDVVDEIELRARPVDEPARFLMADGRALRQRYAGDFVWLRFFDVPVALALRGYAAPGRIVVELVDDSPGSFAAGRFELDASLDGAQCRPTTRSADLTLPARTLAAAYLGGYGLAELRAAGGVDEATPGALLRLHTMLATALAPWCQTGF